jgi:diadenosine tetraphosphatase ApaH/serine/threonine PP2A family protein phosphatase
VRYAILSDVHGRRGKLCAVLADACSRGADRIVSLGDVGGDDCLALLRTAGAMVLFGNYEVSGWRRLAPELRTWVQSWPPLLEDDGFLAVHATTRWPRGLNGVQDAGDWLKRTGLSWRALFPYINDDKDLLWQAVGKLESVDKSILFHGHTHQQSIWHWRPDGHLRQVQARGVTLEVGHRYVVGVGSVGLPQDGGWAAYTMYDAEVGRIKLVRLTR